MLKYKIPTLSFMIIIVWFTTLLFSSTLFSGLTSITSNSEGLGKVSDTSGNTMMIPQAAAQPEEKCLVRVFLNTIEYEETGDNIGDRWTITFGNEMLEDITFKHGTLRPGIGVPEIREFDIDGFGDTIVNLEGYTAREIDPDFDDISGGFLTIKLSCTPQVVSPNAGLFVTERGKGKPGDVAGIVFHFDVFVFGPK